MESRLLKGVDWRHLPVGPVFTLAGIQAPLHFVSRQVGPEFDRHLSREGQRLWTKQLG